MGDQADQEIVEESWRAQDNMPSVHVRSQDSWTRRIVNAGYEANEMDDERA